jgi:hypothetical protein
VNNNTLQLKIKQRLNKLDSADYDNVQIWQIIEAFNKAQIQWIRRQLHGTNQHRSGDEQTKRRIDDLQVLLTDLSLQLKQNTYWFEAPLPSNYLEWKRISAYAKDDCCPVRRMKVYQVEEANIDEILRDINKKPSFDWAETVATLKNNTVFIYTNGEFTLDSATLVFYRQPRRIEIQGVANPYSSQISTTDIECEFKDDIIELIIDESVSILAGDIESSNQRAINTESTEKNN